MLVITTALLGTAAPAYAAEPVESITLSPTSKTIRVDRGATLADSLTVLNDGQTAYTFKVYAAPYSVKDSAYTPDFVSNGPRSDAFQWVQFPQTQWTVEPRQTVTVPYTLRVSPQAAPGGHYGAIFVEVQSGSEGQEQNLARKKRVGSIVYATVNGDLTMKGSVGASTIPWFQSAAPLHASTTIHNTGNGDFLTQTTYTVRDVFGGVKYTETKEYPILPETTRDILFNWDRSPWVGLYNVEINMTVLGKKDVRSGYVVVMPKWLVFLLGLVTLVGIASLLRHRNTHVSSSLRHHR